MCVNPHGDYEICPTCERVMVTYKHSMIVPHNLGFVEHSTDLRTMPFTYTSHFMNFLCTNQYLNRTPAFNSISTTCMNISLKKHLLHYLIPRVKKKSYIKCI